MAEADGREERNGWRIRRRKGGEEKTCKERKIVCMFTFGIEEIVHNTKNLHFCYPFSLSLLRRWVVLLPHTHTYTQCYIELPALTGITGVWSGREEEE